MGHLTVENIPDLFEFVSCVISLAKPSSPSARNISCGILLYVRLRFKSTEKVSQTNMYNVLDDVKLLFIIPLGHLLRINEQLFRKCPIKSYNRVKKVSLNVMKIKFLLYLDFLSNKHFIELQRKKNVIKFSGQVIYPVMFLCFNKMLMFVTLRGNFF